MRPAEQEGKGLYTREELLAQIRTSLGGRAAEIVYYGAQEGISTGASGDLAHATRVAQSIVCYYGMDDAFGLAVVDGPMDTETRAAVNRILREQMALAVRLITENKDKMEVVVAYLLENETMTGGQFRDCMEGKPIGEAEENPLFANVEKTEE
jgi:ATP-dependent Zn protease